VGSKPAAGIRPNKRFALLEEEALLNLLRTHEFIERRQTEFFKRFQLTPTQYNILRILRGAGGDGVSCSEAAERMVTADPDITRLLDRLEARELIVRERRREDRRVVVGRITGPGLELLQTIDKPLAGFLKRRMGRIGKKDLERLIAILESLRGE
jgi:DNA-binding MarR family transcriptional regulator